MSKRAIRGKIYHLKQDPHQSKDCFEYFEDGLLIIENGKVAKLDSFENLKNDYPNYEDESGKFILPGFIDTHIHYPQTEMVGSFGEQLLEWLENYTFPLEANFSDKKYADRVAKLFLDTLLANGTTTALVFPTVHKESVDAFFEEARARKLRMICGKVLMDRHAPENLIDTAESGYQESKELIAKWHGKDRLLYAVTPRFAPTSTPEQLLKAKQLLDEHEGLYMHTHLAENKDEIKWVEELFPDSNSYLNVYADHGLLRERSVFAHCVHLEHSEFKQIAKADAAISFCATSNAFLGSGFFRLAEAEKNKVRVGLGTDIGAGTSFSILQTMNESYKMIKLQKSFAEDPKEIKPLDPHKAFYLATLGGAQALHLEDKIGNFEIGKEADFVVLNPACNQFMETRIKNTKSLEDQLFAIMMLGNQQMIESVSILGEKINKLTP